VALKNYKNKNDGRKFESVIIFFVFNSLTEMLPFSTTILMAKIDQPMTLYFSFHSSLF